MLGNELWYLLELSGAGLQNLGISSGYWLLCSDFAAFMTSSSLAQLASWLLLSAGSTWIRNSATRRSNLILDSPTESLIDVVSGVCKDCRWMLDLLRHDVFSTCISTPKGYQLALMVSQHHYSRYLPPRMHRSHLALKTLQSLLLSNSLAFNQVEKNTRYFQSQLEFSRWLLLLFERWVSTGEDVAYTAMMRPDNIAEKNQYSHRIASQYFLIGITDQDPQSLHECRCKGKLLRCCNLGIAPQVWQVRHSFLWSKSTPPAPYWSKPGHAWPSLSVRCPGISTGEVSITQDKQASFQRTRMRHPGIARPGPKKVPKFLRLNDIRSDQLKHSLSYSRNFSIKIIGQCPAIAEFGMARSVIDL